jgi:hypothetical protein
MRLSWLLVQGERACALSAGCLGHAQQHASVESICPISLPSTSLLLLQGLTIVLFLRGKSNGAAYAATLGRSKLKTLRRCRAVALRLLPGCSAPPQLARRP